MVISDSNFTTQLLEKLCNVAELIIRRQKPFESVPYYPQVTPYLRFKYEEYKDELEDGLKQRIIKRDIDFSRYLIRTALFGFKGQSFFKRYPEHKKTAQYFEKWIEDKKNQNPNDNFNSEDSSQNEKVELSKIIKNEISKRKKDFSFDKTIRGAGLIAFSKKILDKNKFFIVFDKGTQRDFFDVFIGLKSPRVNLDIASFFGLSQSVFDCRTEIEAQKHINVAIDIIDILVPTIMNEVTLILNE